MSHIFGYLRPEPNEQNLQLQLDQLMAAGVSKIFQEKSSDSKRKTTQLNNLLAEARDGDTVVVTSLDRIAHNTKHLLGIMESLHTLGVAFKVINIDIDTTTHSVVLRKLLGAIVAFESHVVRERQAVGIAKAKREGRYKGRKPTARAKSDKVLALNKQGLTRQKIADELEIGVASVYRILKAQKVSMKPSSKTPKKLEKTLVKKKRVERKSTHKIDAEQLSFF